MRTIALQVTPLTAETFAPFGQLLAHPPGLAGQSIGTGDYWPAALPAPEPKIEVGMIHYHHRPLEIRRMERHLRSGQTFFPLSHGPCLLVAAAGHDLADPQALPDPAKLHAFLLPGNVGVRLQPGTWHVSPFPLHAAATFAILAAPRTIEDDSNWMVLPEPLTVTVTL